MDIKAITVWQVPLTSHVAYNMSDGKVCDTVLTTIVRLATDSDHCGWGEVCPIPHYLPAYADGVAPAIEDMSEVLLGASALAPEAVRSRLDAHLQGHNYAKSAIDIALWDLLGKAAGLPLYALLGGRYQKDLPLYHSITCIAPDEMAEIAKEAYASGIRQFQVKLGADQAWETDVERMVKVREAVGDGPLVYGDWNCGSSALDAIRTARAIAHLDVMIEQPCATIAECAAVQKATGLPMKLDESAHDVASILAGHDAGCMQAAALKISKMGGISAMRRVRDLCLTLGTRMCVEDTWGSDIVTAANLHLAASTPPKGVLNTCDLAHYVSPYLAPDTPRRKGGRIAPPEAPGLGINPDLGVLGDPILQIS